MTSHAVASAGAVGLRAGRRTEFRVLGPFRVFMDGTPITLRSSRRRRLLSLLAVRTGSPVPAEALLELLWPGGATREQLYTLISRVRDLFAPDPGVVVELTDGGYRLRAGPAAVDLLLLRQRVRAAREADEHADVPVRVAAWTAVRSLLATPVLADVPEVALRPEVGTVDREVRLIGSDCAAALLACGRAREAGELLDRLAADDPLDELLCALRMRALAAQDRTAAALTLYGQIRRSLAVELGVEPDANLQRTYDRLLAGTAPPDQIPAVESPGEVAHLLADQRQGFFGRARESAAALRRLDAGRLVTIVGPPGVGKTRLAVEVARRAGHAERTALVRLDGLVDGEHVADLIAQVLATTATTAGTAGTAGTADASGATEATLLDRLEGTGTLLVLDNCEHVLDEVARLAALLLHRCPDVRVLATSREALNVDGEAELRLDPLPAPAPGAPAGSDEPAVALFAARARAADPAFVLDDRTVEDVRTICRAVDGLPLALELAAARLRALSVADVAGRLSAPFVLLTQRRTGTDRHRSLRTAIDWSFDLLSAPARSVFAALSVFSGGFDLGAAEAVAAADAGEGCAAALAELVDHSLVTVDHTGAGVRYRLLDVLRQYGAERLDDHEGRRTRHAWHYRELAEDAERRRHTTERPALVALLRREYPNLLAAMRWGRESGQDELGLRLTAALRWFWQVVSPREGYDLVRAGLRAAAPAVTRSRQRALFAAGNLSLSFAPGGAVEHLEEAADLARELGDDEGLVAALNDLGCARWWSGHRSDGVRLYGEALATARRTGDVLLTGRCLCAVALCDAADGRPEEAADHLTDAITLLDRSGAVAVAREARAAGAEMAYWNGSRTRARRLAEEALAGASSGDRYASTAHAVLGLLALEAGDRRAATRRADSSLDVLSETRDGKIAGTSLRLAAALAVDRGDRCGAVVSLGAAGAVAGRYGSGRSPAERRWDEGLLAASGSVPASDLAGAYRRGERLDLDHALGHAREIVSRSYPTS